MLNVSPSFKREIHGESRYTEAKIKLHLLDGEVITLEDDDIIDLELLEELTSNEELPFGGVSSNEFVFSVENMDKKYTPANPASPYYGRIGPGVVVEGLIGLEVEPDVMEYVSLGIYTVSEWRAPSQGVEATVTAYDRLFDLREETVPMLRMTENTTVGELFNILFKSLGLLPNEYFVDESIDYLVPYGFVPQGKVGDVLSSLSQAGMCTVITDRRNRIIVSSSVNSEASVDTWTDDDQIITIDNPEKFNSIYGKASIGIYAASVRRTNTLTNISNIEIASGDTYFEKAEFSTTPVVNLEDVTVKNTAGVVLQELKYGTHQVSILLNNPTAKAQVVTLAMTGVYVAFTKRELLGLSAKPLSKKQLDISNELIQTAEHAQALMNVLLPSITDPFALFELEVRGNPAVELGDVIKIEAPSVKIATTDIQIYRSTIRYDGSLEGTMTGRRVN